MLPDEAEPFRYRRLVVLPLVMGIVALVVATRVSSASALISAVVTFGLFVVLASTLRRHPRTAGIAALAALPWSVAMAIGANRAIESPLVHDTSGLRCGTGEMAFLLVAVPLGALFLLGVSVAIAIAMTRRRVGPASAVNRLDRGITQAAFIVTALASTASIFALLKTGRPEPDAYVASLPIVGALDVTKGTLVAGRELRYVRVAQGRLTHDEADALPTACRLEGIEGSADLGSVYRVDEPCPRARVRYDAAIDLAVVESQYMYGQLDDGEPWGNRVAFFAKHGAPLTIRPSDVAHGIAAPVGWRAAGIIGSVSGIVLLLLAARFRRRAASLTGLDGVHRGDGWVELTSAGAESPEQAPVRVAAAAALPIGPIVLRAAGDRGATYRDVGGPTFDHAVVGTLREHREALMARATSLAAIALTTALFGAMPLFVARLLDI